MPSADVLRPFQLDRSDIRGRFVRLGQTVDFVLRAHAYPDPVCRLLGELLVLAGALAGGLKFDGMFSLQVRSGGPVSLMVADCTNDGAMRGYASFDAAEVAAHGPAQDEELLGDGLLALTVDQRKAGGQISQGIVQLEGRSLVDSMLGYFRRSEQVPTGIRTALDRDPTTGDWRAGAIVLQTLPIPGRESADDDERWREAMLLLATATDSELTDPLLPLDVLIYRLFHERGVRVFEPMRLGPGCSCDEARVRGVLERFTAEDLDEMRLPDGAVAVTCQFCSRSYRFDAAEIDRLIRRRRH
jgi:molecular chaperone Hsp33